MPSTGLSSSRRAVAGPARPADVAIVGGMPELTDLLVRGAAAIAGGTAVAGGFLLVARRLTRAIHTSAPPLVLLAAVAAGVMLVLVADLGARLTGGRAGPLATRIGLLLGMLALALPPAATFGSWAAVGVATAATVAVLLRPMMRASSWPTLRPWPGVAAMPSVASRAPRRRRRRLPGSLRQRYERYELPMGGDCVRGRLAIAVPAEARAAAGHIGFCPAFAETPDVEVTTSYDGVEVTVTAAEVLPWGVRVECRLAEPAEESLEIPVDVLARVAGRSSF
ncbi:MAG: hypothetical protein RLZZ21_1316 [Planctomycetota bacterium]|jgi:hypothetical protein